MAKQALPDHIDSIYPLSPMQEGMLFHTLMNPGTGIYLMQNRYLLEGDLNYDAFVRAWRLVLDRHPVLRTSFVWKNQKRPLQAVHKQVDAPIVSLDWRGQTRPEQIARLDADLEAELREGFDFAKAPLMRLWLIRLADDRYQFVHSFHHILLDEWCISLLLMDFLGHYGSLVRGERPMREKPRPYRDYIAWLQKQDINAAESFWRGYLKNFPTPTPLPYDRLPEGLADQNEDAADHCLYLNADTSAALVGLAQRHRLTVNTFFQGAWALLLNYYSSEREVLFGVTVAGRPTELPGVESILGLFINTLPLRISLQPDRPLIDWLKDLLAENIRVRQYDYAPLVQMQRWSEVPRGEALFHSLFVFENAPVDQKLCEGRIIFKAEEEQYRVHTNYPLTVMGWPGRELGLKISYDKRLFDADTTGRMIRHLKTLLEAMAERPTARLADLSPLKDDERRYLLTEWNPDVEVAGQKQPQSLSWLFEEQAERRPDAVAVECLEDKATYRELNRRANRVAHALAEAGVKSDTVVALLDDRNIDLLTMMLGVFKAGGAYLPLDPHHPVSRLAQILKLSRSPVVLTSQDYLARLQEAVAQIEEASRPRLMLIERILEGAAREENPGDCGCSEHLAYVIYTSGSTGVPKGAMVTRRGMLNNITSKVSGLALGPSDVIAQTASQCFDISVWQFLAALTCGARTSIVPDDKSRDPFHLLRHLERTNITILETVPALLQGLLDAASDTGSNAGARLERLRWVLPTGEALPPPVCRQWLARYPEIPLLNAYGPAECADDVAVHAILEPPADDQTHMPIGRPIERTRLHILNAWLEPVPSGVPGELYVAGVGVGRGYLQDPARTAEVFLPDRFGSEPGARMYRTGDLARYRRDGAIEFVGRVDQQIKLRGFRIELGEIETHLLSSPLVREAAVLLHTAARGEKRLAAYLVGHEGKGPDVPTLRELLQSQLPDYMVPTAFVPLPALPRTPNGKIDRLALAALDLGDQFTRPYTAPRTATEELLAGIWGDILGVERVGIQDNFFELGGHSLLATQIVSRIRNTFEIELQLRAVFESATVEELARSVDAARLTGATSSAPPLVPVARGKELPLSYAQQRLWFLNQLEPDSPSYNFPVVIRLTGQLNLKAVEHGFNEVVRRHEVLRTTFCSIDGKPYQIIAPSLHIPLDILSIDSASEDEQESSLRRLATEEGNRPFDIARGPLMRTTMYRLAEDEHVLVLTMHHIIADGWSFPVLMKELVTFYQAYVEGRPASSPPLAIQYADFAQWQHNWLQGSVHETQLAYWKRQLDGSLPVLELPLDRPRPTVQSYRGKRYVVDFSPELSVALQALSRKQGVTLFMTLLACFQILLARYSGQTDIIIGTPVANRTRSELESLIGFFVNMLVLRVDLSGNPRFTDLLKRVREIVLGAQAHQDLPFEKLVDALQPTRALSHSPLFQVIFVLHSLPPQTLELPGLRIHMPEMDPETAKFDLSLDIFPDPDKMTGWFEYNADLFDEQTIARMAQHFVLLLETIVAAPDSYLEAMPSLIATDREQVVERWNATERTYPTWLTMPELISAQAAASPTVVAVRADEGTLTYGELSARANQLAQALRAQGVGPECLVGIAMERSLDLVISLLGIWQAGAAYVPLDPTYPAERLAYMLADSQAAVLVTHRDQVARLGFSGPTLCLDRDKALLSNYPAAPPPGSFCEHQLAYVIYTSGSTGQPKGAGNTHAGLRNRLQWMQEAYSLTPDDRVLQKTPISFDVSVWEFFWPLMVGAELVLAAPDEHKEPNLLIERIRRTGVTILHFVPPMLQAFLESSGVETCRTLRRIICSGEALPATIPPRVQTQLPGVALHNLYGPTEAAIDVTAWTCPMPPAETVPIGCPIANIRIYVLDAAGHPVPIGVPGELYIGGVGVGRGYHRRPALTADRFVPNPFSAQPGQRLYRTGDRVRYRVDGTIEYLGRLDQQVKIRGFRIELGEIEAMLLQQPGIREAVVMARLEAGGTPQLVGYVKAEAREQLEIPELRRRLQDVLPEYMIPSFFVVLDALPQTPNGKVDRRALPAPDVSEQNAPHYVSPRTPTEEILTGIWADVLNVERVGVHDNFFELGGHSLLALTVLERLRQVGLSTDVRTLFMAPTVSALAAVIGTEGELDVPPNRIPADCVQLTPDMLSLVDLTPDQIAAIVRLVPGGARNIQDIYPLAPLQEGILFHHLLQESGDAYVMPTLLSFDTHERLEGFLRTLQMVIDRHDILRTAVLWEELGEPVQVVWRQARLTIEQVSLEGNGDNRLEQFQARYDPRHYRLDVRQAPLMRGFIAEDPTHGGWLLQLLYHHLICDHTGLELILEEIQTILQGEGEQLPAALPFRNFVAQTRLGNRQAEHEAFFTQMVGDVEEPTLPFGLRNVHGDGLKTTEACLEVAPQLAQQIRLQARRVGVSAASVMHLAWAQVLARISGQQDVVFGTVLFGRMHGGFGVDRVPGLFINTLPIRIDVGRAGVAQGIRATHALLTQLLEHEHASLVLAQRCSGIAAPMPLFSALLNYRHGLHVRTDSASATQKAWEGVTMLSAEEHTNYPLTLSIDDLGEGFVLTAEVSAPLQAQRICMYMHTVLEQLIEVLVTAPDTPVHRLEILPAVERQQLLVEWNTTSTASFAAPTIQELFETQVERTPEAVAVVYGDESLTYETLNARANQLARHLRTLGVGPDVLVGLCVERSLAMIVGLLAILKAGGAYVPLDPAYPPDRLAYILADSQPVVLLTQASLLHTLPAAEIPIFCLDSQWAAVAEYAFHNLEHCTQPAHLAYVIYTSGSTGQPKGVLIQHLNVVRLFSATNNWFEFSSQDTWVLFHSYAFDFSVWEIWGALLYGGKLVVVPFVVTRSSEAFYDLLVKERVTVLNQTPTAFQPLIDIDLGRSDQFSLRLRKIIFGGEALNQISLASWFHAHGYEAPSVINMYGITETTVHVTYNLLQADTSAVSSIGRPIPDLAVYILDVDLEPVPVGVTGELYIAGAGLARGYLRRPVLTAERFVPNPFTSEPGGRMYRSGDLARYLPDGNIEYLGRIDHQVKIRGFRIELGEIEAAVRAIAEVREAVVLVREDSPGDKRLVAYVATETDIILSGTEMRSRLTQVLPEYMVPAQFVFLDQFPLTPNGKINRKALPAPDVSDQLAHQYVAPRTPTEKMLAEIWAEVLHVPRVGVHDSFFELGGHSLLAIRLVSRIRETSSAKLDLVRLFSAPTVAELSVVVDEAEKTIDSADVQWMTGLLNELEEKKG